MKHALYLSLTVLSRTHCTLHHAHTLSRSFIYPSRTPYLTLSLFLLRAAAAAPPRPRASHLPLPRRATPRVRMLRRIYSHSLAAATAKTANAAASATAAASQTPTAVTTPLPLPTATTNEAIVLIFFFTAAADAAHDAVGGLGSIAQDPRGGPNGFLHTHHHSIIKSNFGTYNVAMEDLPPPTVLPYSASHCRRCCGVLDCCFNVR